MTDHGLTPRGRPCRYDQRVDDPGARPLLSRRLHRRELIALDGLAAALYMLVFLGTAAARESGVPTWARCVIVGGVGAPLLALRLWPLPVFGVVLAMSVLALSLGVVREPFVAAAFALYMVAPTWRRPRREPALAIGAMSVVVILVGALGGSPAGDPADAGLLVLGGAIMGGTWTVGRAVRERRWYAARAAEQLARQAAAEERLRIARELHDVVSHTLGLIGVKAAIANHVADSRPREARDALRLIETTSRDALTQMRSMLGVLRSDQVPADFRPPPGLADLPQLAERAALAGVQVDLEVRGVDQLPPAMELSVYRIVQEAVTNVVKHAAPASCRVTVAGTPDEVRVEVTDDGSGQRRSSRHSGHGLIGMRERTVMHGGDFSAGPGPGGGFAVRARLPLGEPAG
jgi:signal transduction histidine kinase